MLEFRKAKQKNIFVIVERSFHSALTDQGERPRDVQQEGAVRQQRLHAAAGADRSQRLHAPQDQGKRFLRGDLPIKKCSRAP